MSTISLPPSSVLYTGRVKVYASNIARYMNTNGAVKWLCCQIPGENSAIIVPSHSKSKRRFFIKLKSKQLDAPIALWPKCNDIKLATVSHAINWNGQTLPVIRLTEAATTHRVHIQSSTWCYGWRVEVKRLPLCMNGSCCVTITVVGTPKERPANFRLVSNTSDSSERLHLHIS
jgi:hypothetical protein